MTPSAQVRYGLISIGNIRPPSQSERLQMKPSVMLQGRTLPPRFDCVIRIINPVSSANLQEIAFGCQPGKLGANIWPRRCRKPALAARLASTTANLHILGGSATRGNSASAEAHP